jgi:hypothetical protein
MTILKKPKRLQAQAMGYLNMSKLSMASGNRCVKAAERITWTEDIDKDRDRVRDREGTEREQERQRERDCQRKSKIERAKKRTPVEIAFK